MNDHPIGELINNLREMGKHEMAEWVSKDTISRAGFDPDDFRECGTEPPEGTKWDYHPTGDSCDCGSLLVSVAGASARCARCMNHPTLCRCAPRACELCWAQAFTESRMFGDSQADHYKRLLAENEGKPGHV
jgi:hypothetical protein